MVSAVNSLESAAGRLRLLQPSSEQLVQSHGTESHLWITSPFGQGGVECRDPRVPPRVAKPKTTNTIDPGGRLLSTAASARPRAPLETPIGVAVMASAARSGPHPQRYPVVPTCVCRS